ncbi:MAG TPA: thermonuclease family protein [Thermomicrobiales bacterium]|nr:thermonuclease family protein [Thermomicrobiales bacterium]
MRFLSRAGAVVMTLLFLLSGLTVASAADPTPTPVNVADDFDYFGAIPWELPDDAQEMVVDKVHDGDSINLTKPNDTWWEKYRLIGIQAPEIEGYKHEECYGKDATAFLKALLPKGTHVWVQRDISDKDVNDRFLRHVFIQDEKTGEYYLLSEVLVLGGYAKARSYPPDDLYDDVLAEAQDIAQQDDVGLWNVCETH